MYAHQDVGPYEIRGEDGIEERKLSLKGKPRQLII